MQTIQVNNHKVLWLYVNSMGPNYVYNYSKSHSYSRSDLPCLNTEKFRYIEVIKQPDETYLQQMQIETEITFPQRLWPCSEGTDPAGGVFLLTPCRGILKYCGYTKTRWDLITSTVIARATHTLAATLALRRPQAEVRPGRWSISLNTMQENFAILSG